MTRAPETQAVLRFWFGEPPQSYAERRKLWFGKQPEFDATIRQQFQQLYEQAATGALDGWAQAPQGCLALILILDQFSRNMFRDKPQAFATDAKALALAWQAVDADFDRELTPLQRIFLYLPFEHSEQIADQAQSVQRFEQLYLEQPELMDVWGYAKRHQAVVEQFRRFPHRNAILGRETTPAEAEFLQQPGSSF